MRKIIALILIIAVTTIGCAHNAIRSVEATDGEVYNVRTEREEPTAMDVPIVWGDYLLWTGIGYGVGIIGLIVVAGIASDALNKYSTAVLSR